MIVSDIKKYLYAITLEPCFFFFNLALLLAYPSFNSLVYLKAQEYVVCSHWKTMGNLTLFNTAFTDVSIDICPKIFRQDQFLNYGNITSDVLKVESQRLAASYIFYSTLAYSIPAIFLALFIGPWSDKFGRDKPIMLPFIGALCQAVINSLIASFYEITIHYIIIGSIINGLFGGMVIEMLGLFSFLSHHSNKEQRTLKFAILESLGLTGILLGTLLSGVLLKILTLKYVFLIIFSINILGLSYFFIMNNKLKNIAYNSLTTAKPAMSIRAIIYELVYPIFNNSQIKIICLICLTLNVLTFVTIGEFDTMYLFVAHRFDWPANRYGYFLAVWKMGEIFSLIIILPILKKLSCTDLTIAIFGLISKLSGLILLGLATSSSMVFLAGILSLMDSTPSAVLRSTVSKTVENKDLGKLFAVIAVTEAITTILSSLTFTKLYSFSLTATEFGGNGMVYFVGAILLFITVGFITYVHMLAKRSANSVISAQERPQNISKEIDVPT